MRRSRGNPHTSCSLSRDLGHGGWDFLAHEDAPEAVRVESVLAAGNHQHGHAIPHKVSQRTRPTYAAANA